MKIEMETQTMEKFAKEIADEALKLLEINDMPLEDFIVQVDKLMGFLQCEIDLCESRLQDRDNYYNPCYDGEGVGSYKIARKLQERHLKFCQRMLRMLTDKNAN